MFHQQAASVFAGERRSDGENTRPAGHPSREDKKRKINRSPMDDNQNSQRKQAEQCARRNAQKCPRSRSTENKAVWRDHFGEARKLLRGRATAEREEEDAVEAPTAATSSAELVPCCCALSVGLSSGTAFASASHLSRARGTYRVAMRKTKLCPPPLFSPVPAFATLSYVC